MSAPRNCPACGQTINSVNDAIFCTRRTPCLVATHYGTMCSEPVRFANEEDRVVGLMNRVHGYAVQALHAAEKAVGIRHDPPPPAAEIQPQVPPAVETDGGGFLHEVPVSDEVKAQFASALDNESATPASASTEDSVSDNSQPSGALGAAARSTSS